MSIKFDYLLKVPVSTVHVLFDSLVDCDALISCLCHIFLDFDHSFVQLQTLLRLDLQLFGILRDFFHIHF